jgi:hypothetical protein
MRDTSIGGTLHRPAPHVHVTAAADIPGPAGRAATGFGLPDHGGASPATACISCAAARRPFRASRPALMLASGQGLGAVLDQRTERTEELPQESDGGSQDNDSTSDEGQPAETRWRKRGPKTPHRRLSEVLNWIAADESRERVTIADLLALMEGRARAALIFLFAIPNVLPAPPGLSGVLGLPLLYLTAQMMLGRVPWLPRFVISRGLTRPVFAAVVERVGPFLARAERLLKPRWSWLTGPVAERLLGALGVVLAAVISLPIPLGNILPAFALCLIALAILERDGLWVAIGATVAAVSLALSATVVYGMIKAGIFILEGAFR